MSKAYGSSYIRFLPSNYFSEKIETDQIQIGKGPVVFKNYWKLKNTISKITLKPIMMRARTENAIAHFKKNQVGAHFVIPGNKIKNECISTDAGQNLTPLLLHWNLHTCAPIKNTDKLWDRRKNREKIKIRSVRNERLSLASRDGISEIVHKKWVRQNVTDPLLIKTSKSKSEKVRWHQILLPMVKRSHFNFLMAHQRNTFRWQDLYDFTFCFFFEMHISTWKPSFGGPNKKKNKKWGTKNNLWSRRKTFISVWSKCITRV